MKSNWADDVEDIDGRYTASVYACPRTCLTNITSFIGLGLPPNTEEYKNGMKIVTEYGLDDDNKKFKVVRHYKVEKRQVAKAIAQRKSWAKFGLSKEDKPGPNPATTVVSEDVFMQVYQKILLNYEELLIFSLIK